ncbi:Rne/Rng family ribonuclease [Petroclostridium sp. X23]|uniref:Rne/Rng family ribonuclease n=1 Tax=Petroclostridium sp. X23 TaxID=3045146 RepID=UPI0024AE24D1|nr:Rne/Rng family ribonuclease [Petroclostridium sp. X23]WHH58161.1 Rne/Rng family ribonuclease [Petroclostridium sp. X23]
MSNEIVVDVRENQIRVAVMEERELVELYIESPEHQGMVGNIYRGKVMSVLPGMQAAFVDIGYEKNAFLYVKDIITGNESADQFETSVHEGGCGEEPCISDVIRNGEEITVQILKEPIGTKGPRVTTNITLPGRYLVLLPNADYIGVSKKIDSEEERQRLKNIAANIKRKNMGLIIRTEGEGKELSDFKQDLNFLIKLWSKIKNKEKTGRVPRMIHKDFNLLFRTVRDLFTWNTDKFIINDKGQYSNVVELVDMLSPSLTGRVEYFSKKYDIFEYYQVEGKISKALERKVWLKCGGHIVIDQTEALTAIDVNTGKYVGEIDLEDTVLKTNLDAAKEIAKQLRLRDIGGIIIIDFIDMHGKDHRDKVIETLKHYLKKDKTKTTVVGITHLGLVEMTRKKVRERLSTLLKIDCPYCAGRGKILSPEVVARLTENEIYKVCTQSMAPMIEIQIHPSVVPFLLGEDERNIKRLEDMFNKKITIQSCKEMKCDDIIVKDVDNTNAIC